MLVKNEIFFSRHIKFRSIDEEQLRQNDSPTALDVQTNLRYCVFRLMIMGLEDQVRQSK